MTLFTCKLLLVSLQYLLLHGYKNSALIVQKPSTPIVCRELCEASTDSTKSFSFIKEDHSCRRVLSRKNVSWDPFTTGETHRHFRSGMDDHPDHSRAGMVTVGERQPVKLQKDNAAKNISMLTSILRTNHSTIKDARTSAGTPHPTSVHVRNGDKGSIQCNPEIYLPTACEKGRLVNVRTILSHGLENINCRGNHMRTPAMIAARNGQLAVFDFLVSEGCDLSLVDDDNNTILHIATLGGDINIIRKLLDEHGFKTDTRGQKGITPVMIAAFCCHTSALGLLVRRGCSLTQVNEYNDTILHWACQGHCKSVVKYVLSKHVVSIESRGSYGRTPVLRAALFGSIRTVKFLIKRGCNLRAVDNWGNSIFHLVCREGHLQLVKFFIALGVASEDKNNFGETPLQAAERSGHQAVVSLLKSTFYMSNAGVTASSIIHI